MMIDIKELNPLMNNEFTWPIRVYYEDTDAGGIVYYANYLKFYERARTEWLNHLKIDQVELLKHDVVFVVTKADIDYLKPAKLNDKLVVVSRILKVTAATLEFEQCIYLASKDVTSENLASDDKESVNIELKYNDGQNKSQQTVLLNKASIKVACLKLASFSPCRIPATIKKEFQRVS
jgi:acyl-CoA thioester hydrolase